MSLTSRDTGSCRGFVTISTESMYVGVNRRAAASAMSIRKCSHASLVVGTTMFCAKNADSKSSTMRPGSLICLRACLQQHISLISNHLMHINVFCSDSEQACTGVTGSPAVLPVLRPYFMTSAFHSTRMPHLGRRTRVLMVGLKDFRNSPKGDGDCAFNLHAFTNAAL
jgi:hypothetical protein